MKENQKNILIWSSSNIDDLIEELAVHNYIVKGVLGCDSNVVSVSGGLSKIEAMMENSLSKPDLNIKDMERTLLPKFIETYSRLERSSEKNNFGFDGHGQIHERFEYYKNRLSMYCYFFSSLIDELEVEAVWFLRVPHLGIDNVLYEISRQKGLCTLVTWQSLFSDKFFYGSEVDELFQKKELEWIEGNVVQNSGQFNLFYMNNSKDSYSKFVKRIRARVRNWLRLDDVNTFRMSLAHMLLSASKESLYRNKINSISYVLPEGDYIYFPLHLQPEATTAVLGGGYSDQVDAIENLSLRCPSGWRILLKENPKQDSKFRPVEFFRRIEALGNVFWVNPQTSSHELIVGSRFVATITGTAGYEAILNEKSCVYFGNAWYQDLPGAFQFKKDLDFFEVEKSVAPRQEVVSALACLLKLTADGVVYSSYSKISKTDRQESITVTAASLSRIDRAYSNRKYI